VKVLKIFRENARHARLQIGISQELLAEKAGLAYQHYQDIEAGRRDGLRLVTIERIAKALEVPVWKLFEPGHFPKPQKKRGRSKKIDR
jgi:transcriptional regulator with XRE-family HTH domain